VFNRVKRHTGIFREFVVGTRRALENESSSRLSLEDTIKRLRRHNSDSLHDSDIAKSVNDDSREKSSPGRGSDYETKRNPSDRASVRPMSPIDIYNGAGGNDEDDDYTRETAISSLSGTSSWYPSPYKDKNSSEASPISISEAKRRDRSWYFFLQIATPNILFHHSNAMFCLLCSS
jgi:hypothetical protein